MLYQRATENWTNRTYECKWINEERRKPCNTPRLDCRIFYLSSSQLSSLLSLTARINPGQVVKEFPPTEPNLRPPAADSSAIYSPLYFLPRVFTFAWKSLVKKKRKLLLFFLRNFFEQFNYCSSSHPTISIFLNPLHRFENFKIKLFTCVERSLVVDELDTTEEL